MAEYKKLSFSTDDMKVIKKLAVQLAASTGIKEVSMASAVMAAVRSKLEEEKS